MCVVTSTRTRHNRRLNRRHLFVERHDYCNSAKRTNWERTRSKFLTFHSRLVTRCTFHRRRKINTGKQVHSNNVFKCQLAERLSEITTRTTLWDFRNGYGCSGISHCHNRESHFYFEKKKARKKFDASSNLHDVRNLQTTKPKSPISLSLSRKKSIELNFECLISSASFLMLFHRFPNGDSFLVKIHFPNDISTHEKGFSG